VLELEPLDPLAPLPEVSDDDDGGGVVEAVVVGGGVAVVVGAGWAFAAVLSGLAALRE